MSAIEIWVSLALLILLLAAGLGLGDVTRKCNIDK